MWIFMNLKSHILSPSGRKSLKRDFFQRIWLCHFSLHCILTSGKKIENFYKQFQRKTLDRQKNKRTNRQTDIQPDKRTMGHRVLYRTLTSWNQNQYFHFCFVIVFNHHSLLLPPALQENLSLWEITQHPSQQNIFQPPAPIAKSITALMCIFPKY